MNYRTHLAFGLFLSLIFILVFNVKRPIIFIVLALIGSLLPDIDHPKSKMGSLFWPLPYLFHHRGFFHSIFPLIGFFFLIRADLLIFIPIGLGYASHIFADMLTPKGVMIIHPIIKVRVSGFIETGSFLEKIFLLILTLTNISLVFIVILTKLSYLASFL